MPQFFVSFNSADRVWVRHFVNRLKIAFDDVDIFFDEATIKTGDEWWGVICHNIAQSNAMLYILTNDFFRSKYCRAEFLEAQRLGVPTIPILARPHTAMPFSFSSLNFIDMTQWFNTELPEKIYSPLYKSLRGDISGRRGTAIPHPDRSVPSYWDWPPTVHNPGWLGEPTPPPATPAPKIEVKQPSPPPKPKLPRVEAILPAPFEWCAIPGGEVHLKRNTFGNTDDYVPAGGQTFRVEPFHMAKYCITNAQFEVFVQASDGYANTDWWGYSEAASKWRKKMSLEATAYAGDDLPRTEVSWYEAMAFCQWLSAKTGENITLPTEQQWQFAAQGTDGRTYPWGDEVPTAELLNYNMNVGEPTPVGSYPHGASPFGVLNMAGNVWEWCITPWETGNNQNISSTSSRVLRGGSFPASQDDAVVSDRNGLGPLNRDDLIGFRVALSSPIS